MASPLSFCKNDLEAPAICFLHHLLREFSSCVWRGMVYNFLHIPLVKILFLFKTLIIHMGSAHSWFSTEAFKFYILGDTVFWCVKQNCRKRNTVSCFTGKTYVKNYRQGCLADSVGGACDSIPTLGIEITKRKTNLKKKNYYQIFSFR